MATSQSMFKSIPKTRLPRQFARLNLISNYPNSAVRLPSNVKSLELIFKNDSKHGHMGAKRFWKRNLPTIQFHNPSLPINITRVNVATDEESVKCPAILNLILENGDSKKIDMKNKFSDDIMVEFKELSGAEEVPVEEIPVHER